MLTGAAVWTGSGFSHAMFNFLPPLGASSCVRDVVCGQTSKSFLCQHWVLTECEVAVW